MLGAAMGHLYEPPLNQIVAALLALVGLFAAVRGGRQVVRGVRHAEPLPLVQGIRGCVVAVVAGTSALGLLAAQTGLLVFGTIFLGEELYETGVLIAIIRSARARTQPREVSHE
jgi:hypothetical protein